MHITRHATARARERLGIPSSAVERNAAKALNKGISPADTKGSLRRYMDWLYFRYGTANNIRILTHYVYLFRGELLITIIPLPQEYRNTVDKITRRNAHARAL